MIPRLVPEILPCDAFCDEQQQQEEQEQELGILGVRLSAFKFYTPKNLSAAAQNVFACCCAVSFFTLFIDSLISYSK